MCGAKTEGSPEAMQCPRAGGRVHAFLQPWLLLLLAQRPGHGYDLMARLGDDEELPCAEPGLLYRTLRQMEEVGCVTSEWDTTAAGPARRVYSITAQGLEMLHAWKPRIEHVRRRLDRFLEEYARYVSE